MTFEISPTGRRRRTLFNSAGQPVAVESPGVFAVTNTYDTEGRLVRTVQGARETKFAYDAAGCLASVTDALGRSVNTGYDAVGRAILTALPDGSSVSNAYDRSESPVATTLPHGETHAFGWTPVGLPASYTAPEAPDAGRRIERAYNAAREQVAFVKPDSNGVTLTWNLFGRLMSVGDVSYWRDEQQRLCSKEVGGEPVKDWMWSGSRLVAEYDSAADEISVFVYAGATAPAYMIRDGVTYRFITDNQGSVRLVVNTETGGVAQRLDYDSFGRVLRDTNPGFQPFGFQGGHYDPDTGLVEFGCRWYDAETGRWISKDPILLDGGLNVYAFCDNDPVNRTDPSGLCEGVSWIDGIQTFLDGAGVLDPTPACDSLNALIYAFRGRWSDAWISVLGIIPYAGDAAKLGKYGVKVYKLADKGIDAANTASRFTKAAQAASKTSSAVA